MACVWLSRETAVCDLLAQLAVQQRPVRIVWRVCNEVAQGTAVGYLTLLDGT